MLDLHLSTNQCLGIETPSGGVEVCVIEVNPESSQASIEVTGPDDWDVPLPGETTFKLHEELVVTVPDGQIRLKLLRFRPRPDGTGGSVSLGIDAPREWPVFR
jgi:hypothetical protein